MKTQREKLNEQLKEMGAFDIVISANISEVKEAIETAKFKAEIPPDTDKPVKAYMNHKTKKFNKILDKTIEELNELMNAKSDETAEDKE